MTEAPDKGRPGEEPEPESELAGREPEVPEPEVAAALELADPEDPNADATGESVEGGSDPEPSASKRRHSRSRSRNRRKEDPGAAGDGAPSSGVGLEQEAIDDDVAGDGKSRKTARATERPVPVTYGALEAAFFDLDKTVIAKASMVAFGRPFYHGGLIDRRTVLRALYGQLVYLHLGASEQKLNRIRESVLRLTKGWNRDRVCEIVEEAIEAIVEPIIFAEAADLIDWHHEEGRMVVIVSASPDEIVTPLSKFLGADVCIASRAKVDDQGRYTGSMEFYAYGPFKAEAIDALAAERGVDLAASYAYTDSYTDLPMLEAVGHPVAVNPDRVLSRYAREHDIEILHFSHTVSLWSRVRDRIGSVPPRPAIALSAGAFALGAGAAAAGWWLGSRRRVE